MDLPFCMSEAIRNNKDAVVVLLLSHRHTLLKVKDSVLIVLARLHPAKLCLFFTHTHTSIKILSLLNIMYFDKPRCLS